VGRSPERAPEVGGTWGWAPLELESADRSRAPEAGGADVGLLGGKERARPGAGAGSRRGSSVGPLKQESRAQLGAGAGGQGGAQPGAGARSGRGVGVGPLEKAQTGVGRRKREGPMWAFLKERRGRGREQAPEAGGAQVWAPLNKRAGHSWGQVPEDRVGRSPEQAPEVGGA
jgi:hypothetical protein